MECSSETIDLVELCTQLPGGSPLLQTLLQHNNAPSDEEWDIFDEEMQMLQNKLKIIENSANRIRAAIADRVRVLSIIRKVPPEIISEIFSFVASSSSRPSPFDTNSFPYVLCRVCSRWRRLAHATPSLWNRMDLILQDIDDAMPEHWDLEDRAGKFSSVLGSWFHKSSRSRSAGVRLIVVVSNRLSSPNVLYAYVAALFSYTEHFEDLILCNWEHVENVTSTAFLSCPKLRRLVLYGCAADGPHFSLHAPGLRSVTYKGTAGSQHVFSPTILPWSQLTSLSFKWSPALSNIQIQAIRVARHGLQELSLTSTLDSGSFSGFQDQSVISMPRLTLFAHETGRGALGTELDMFYMPSLRTLRFQPDSSDGVVWEKMIKLLVRSSCTLGTIEINFLDYHPPQHSFPALLACAVHAMNVKLSGLHIECALELLYCAEEGSDTFLPNMSNLQLFKTEAWVSLAVPASVVNLIYSRLNGSPTRCAHLSSVLLGEVDEPLHAELQNHLQHWSRSGVAVTWKRIGSMFW